MIEEYVIECIKQEKLLNIREIAECDGLSFGEGPVYNHFGGIERFKFQVMIEVFTWTKADQEAILEEHGMHLDDVLYMRIL